MCRTFFFQKRKNLAPLFSFSRQRQRWNRHDPDIFFPIASSIHFDYQITFDYFPLLLIRQGGGMQKRCKDLYGFIADLSYISVLDIDRNTRISKKRRKIKSINHYRSLDSWIFKWKFERSNLNSKGRRKLAKLFPISDRLGQGNRAYLPIYESFRWINRGGGGGGRDCRSKRLA